MEVILSKNGFHCCKNRILHVCGGDPINPFYCVAMVEYSPRMWRWSLWRVDKVVTVMVFSTYVEVILVIPFNGVVTYCILHVCGGDPLMQIAYEYEPEYSPRMWRWSLISLLSPVLSWVFSTYVEVILATFASRHSAWCILHVCGGDPNTFKNFFSVSLYSPRMWRWS